MELIFMVLEFPIATEKAINMVEKENKLTFVVNKRATKKQIKEELEKKYGVKVADVNTNITIKGEKRAYIKLAKGFLASDLAVKLKII
ncbi:50S ribosomal protein L23 [Candidatus Micrarchaeota archaeon]|nr:50S ribosomal protein L23 [Candidatus Micrarchaeota archaeon]